VEEEVYVCMYVCTFQAGNGFLILLHSNGIVVLVVPLQVVDLFLREHAGLRAAILQSLHLGALLVVDAVIHVIHIGLEKKKKKRRKKIKKIK
jgi:hypothetical protein